MGRVSDRQPEVLPEFQKYLLDKQLAPDKNIPYLAYWVSRFLTFAQGMQSAFDKKSVKD